jgi:hypothetical protein
MQSNFNRRLATFFLLTSCSIGFVSAAEFGVDYGWGLPVTIEVLQDVRAEVGHPPGKRGILYSNAAFSISRGERFEMIEVHQEGGCKISVKEKVYDLSSCPWLTGFPDHQGDIFKVISTGSEAR